MISTLEGEDKKIHKNCLIDLNRARPRTHPQHASQFGSRANKSWLELLPMRLAQLSSNQLSSPARAGSRAELLTSLGGGMKPLETQSCLRMG
jgi:hypothetical protein